MDTFRTLALALVAALAACGGGSGSAGTGTMRLALTDAPACGYDEVNVTVEKVRVHGSGGAGDDDAGWSEIVLSTPRRIDLLSLTNGVLEELGQTQLPAGTYQQLRLVLAPNTGARPFANSLVPSGGSETALDTPSGQQSGLKMNVNLTVEPDKIADFVIDLDACKSIKVTPSGGSNGYNLRPVVRVLPVLSDAGQRIVGYVDASIAHGSTRISVQQNGIEVKATPPLTAANASGADIGKFVLYPVPAGSYDLVVTADGKATAVMTGVPVTTTAVTHANPAGARIAPPASAMQAATATVSVVGSALDVDVVASQTLDGGAPTVAVASASSSAGTGVMFPFSLPVGAPQRTAYVAAATTLAFMPMTGAAGKYAIKATPDGLASKDDGFDFGVADATATFLFP
jgi:hypothetical protein